MLSAKWYMGKGGKEKLLMKIKTPSPMCCRASRVNAAIYGCIELKQGEKKK